MRATECRPRRARQTRTVHAVDIDDADLADMIILAVAQIGDCTAVCNCAVTKTWKGSSRRQAVWWVLSQQRWTLPLQLRDPRNFYHQRHLLEASTHQVQPTLTPSTIDPTWRARTRGQTLDRHWREGTAYMYPSWTEEQRSAVDMLLTAFDADGHAILSLVVPFSEAKYGDDCTWEIWNRNPYEPESVFHQHYTRFVPCLSDVGKHKNAIHDMVLCLWRASDQTLCRIGSHYKRESFDDWVLCGDSGLLAEGEAVGEAARNPEQASISITSWLDVSGDGDDVDVRLSFLMGDEVDQDAWPFVLPLLPWSSGDSADVSLNQQQQLISMNTHAIIAPQAPKEMAPTMPIVMAWDMKHPIGKEVVLRDGPIIADDRVLGCRVPCEVGYDRYPIVPAPCESDDDD